MHRTRGNLQICFGSLRSPYFWKVPHKTWKRSWWRWGLLTHMCLTQGLESMAGRPYSMLVLLLWRDVAHLIWPGRLLGSVFVNGCRWQLPLVMPPFSQTLLCKQYGSANIRPCHKSLKMTNQNILRAERSSLFHRETSAKRAVSLFFS